MKILFLDIETAPNTAHVWGLWQQNVGLNQLLESSYVMCWAAKWHGQKEIMYDSVFESTPTRMLKRIHALLDEADAVVHYNGTRFDIPTLNKEFLLHNLTPPSPAKQIDLLKVCKNRFRFPSNRLDYVAHKLGLGRKNKTTHELWIQCMARDPKAWEVMKKYNKQDVNLLEKVYERVKPWIKQHANYSLYAEQSLCCPNCSSTAYQKRGYTYTQTAKYARYQCTGCGNWFRGGVSVAPKPTQKFVNI